MKSDPIDEFRRQADVYPPDNLHRIMPVAVFRVTWTEAGENKEARSQRVASDSYHHPPTVQRTACGEEG